MIKLAGKERRRPHMEDKLAEVLRGRPGFVDFRGFFGSGVVALSPASAPSSSLFPASLRPAFKFVKRSPQTSSSTASRQDCGQRNSQLATKSWSIRRSGIQAGAAVAGHACRVLFSSGPGRRPGCSNSTGGITADYIVARELAPPNVVLVLLAHFGYTGLQQERVGGLT
jgi:hypothetical protein